MTRKSAFFLLCLLPVLARADDPALTKARKQSIYYRAFGLVQGHCTQLSDLANPLPAACKDVTLVLRTEDGKLAGKADVTEQGDFKFKAENGVRYRITSGTEGFEVTSPSRPILGGDLVDVKISATE